MTKLSRSKESLKRALKKMRLFGLAARLYQGYTLAPEMWSSVRSRWLGKLDTTSELPVPPPELVSLVAGINDIPWFLQGGQLAFDSIQETLHRCGVTPNDLGKVLDFGCGCGRVIRYWRSVDGVKVFGTDYNPALIKWCKRNLAFASFKVNNLNPPLNYKDNEFDLVYALSVFTHLSEPLQFAWMNELRRVIRPGGYLLITAHGKVYIDQLSETERIDYDKGDLVVREETSSGSNYCAAFHPDGYIRNKLANGFTVVDFVPEGAKGNPRQDLYLLQKS